MQVQTLAVTLTPTASTVSEVRPKSPAAAEDMAAASGAQQLPKCAAPDDFGHMFFGWMLTEALLVWAMMNLGWLLQQE